jgi:hypothetical protein
LDGRPILLNRKGNTSEIEVENVEKNIYIFNDSKGNEDE